MAKPNLTYVVTIAGSNYLLERRTGEPGYVAHRVLGTDGDGAVLYQPRKVQNPPVDTRAALKAALRG